jgi:O-antigen ligase
MTILYFLLIMTGDVRISKVGIYFLYLVIIGILWVGQTLLVNSEGVSLGTTLKIFMTLFMCMTYCNSKQEQNILRFRFVIKTIFALSLISNILFLLLIVGFPMPTIRPAYGSGDGTMSIIYLEQYFRSGLYGILGYRNSGIYWEPGMYQIYLNLLVIYYLYKENNNSSTKWIVLYLIISIITTGSVTGYALCAIEMALYAINNSRRIGFKIIIGVVTATALIIAVPYFSSMLENKMTIGNSFEHRFSDLTSGWSFILQRPILGYGPNTSEYSNYYHSVFGVYRGNTNGMVSIFIQFGILGFIAYVISFFHFCKYGSVLIGNRAFWPLIIWTIVSFNTEPITTHTIVFFFMSLGISYMLYYYRDDKNIEGESNNSNGKYYAIQ